MGAAKRVDGYPWLVSEPCSSSEAEPEVELGFSDWGVDDWAEVEQTDPWCVDDGERIVVMRTRDIRRGIQRGVLARGVKVWRDGRACWLPVDEVYELGLQDDDTAPSRIRRVRRPAPDERATRTWGTNESWWRRTLLMFFGGIALGVAVMVGLAPPRPAQLEHVAARVTGALGR